MARPRTYDRDEALFGACEAFWKFGYKGLSVRALEHETDLNQFAIQKEFGGKENFYIEALQLYVDETNRTVLKPIREGNIDDVEFFFTCLGEADADVSSKWGCMIVNAGIENATLKNSKITKVTDNYWQALSSAFLSALKESRSKKKVKQEVDIKKATEALVVAAIGIHTCNRINNSLTAGVPLAQVMRSSIASWKVGST